jgi:hypothetical protein
MHVVYVPRKESLQGPHRINFIDHVSYTTHEPGGSWYSQGAQLKRQMLKPRKISMDDSLETRELD